jgi:hypothetical protein
MYVLSLLARGEIGAVHLARGRGWGGVPPWDARVVLLDFGDGKLVTLESNDAAHASKAPELGWAARSASI